MSDKNDIELLKNGFEDLKKLFRDQDQELQRLKKLNDSSSLCIPPESFQGKQEVNLQPAIRVLHQEVLDEVMRMLQEHFHVMVLERDVISLMNKLFEELIAASKVKESVEKLLGKYAIAGESLDSTLERIQESKQFIQEDLFNIKNKVMNLFKDYNESVIASFVNSVQDHESDVAKNLSYVFEIRK